MLFNKRGECIIFFYLLYLKYDYYIYIHRLFPDSKRWQLEKVSPRCQNMKK